jgi:hypothetical protein
VGRRHLSRLAALLLVVLACAPAALAAGAQHLVAFSLVGATEPTGAQEPHAYLAVRKSDIAGWARRLSRAQHARVAGVDFERRIVVAAFLDGLPCASDVRLNGLVHDRRSLIVTVSYKRPPIGVATCVRTSVRYVVLAVDRSALGRLPMRVDVKAVARA